ncbi:MAG: S1C family serine protease, partial [Planctomycetota bacterium]
MIAKCKRHIETLFILYCALVLFSSYGTVQGQEAIEALEEKAILKAIENISESVIRIESVGGLSKVEGTTTQLAPVTATIIAEDGYAVSSSFHFVSRPVGLIATLPDGTKCKATVVGKDKSRNLVLIKLTTDQTFELPRSANRTSISVGETVIAIGRGLSSDSINVSTGILSAKNRIWGKAFQTDAKISPVNFGGPLLNLKGELIGVLTPMSLGSEAVTARYDWYDSGVGFAIPVGDIKSRLIQLKSGISIRPGLPGFSFQNQNQFQTPLTVGFVSPGSPAASAGLRQGDIIKSANGKPTKNQAEFKHLSKP